MINNNNNEIGAGFIINNTAGEVPAMHRGKLKYFARIRHENRKKKFFLPHWCWDGSKIIKMTFIDYINWLLRAVVINKLK